MYDGSTDDKNEICPGLSDLKMSLKPDADKTQIKGCSGDALNKKFVRDSCPKILISFSGTGVVVELLLNPAILKKSSMPFTTLKLML